MFLLGKEVAENIKLKVKSEVEQLKRKPTLCILLNKEDSSSVSYANSIIKSATFVGINAFVKDVNNYDNDINYINNSSEIDACLITRPLLKGTDERRIISLLNPNKDVDAISAENIGKILHGDESLVPNTAKAIIEMIEYHNISLSGKKVLIIGRSISVGKPVAMLLLNRNATVTIAHSRTNNLDDELSKYDIIIAAVGKPHLIDGDKMKEGAIVIDAGIHYLEDGIKGDVKPSARLSLISKVPGGVGPITSACLMQNVLSCYRRNNNGK